MTNDRRKTFATPLEFWQWAIMGPGKRKARTIHGEIRTILTMDEDGRPLPFGEGPGCRDVYHGHCPLTAIEDEHGAIEDSEEKEKSQLWLETACDLIRASTFSGNDVKDKHNYDKSAAGMMIEAIQIIADERIAAATVETVGPKGFESNNFYRLKPKGD